MIKENVTSYRKSARKNIVNMSFAVLQKKNHKKNSISDRIDKTQEIEAHIAAKYYKKKNSHTKSSVA